MKRRRVVVPVTPKVFCNLVIDSGDDCVIFSVKSGIPKDAKFIGVNWDYQKDIFYVCYEHESFPETEFGYTLPDVKPEFTIYYV